MSATAARTNVTAIGAGTASNSEPATVPIAKKTRTRDDLSQATTLARAIRKADKEIADEVTRHETALAKKKASRAELLNDASESVLKLAEKLLAE